MLESVSFSRVVLDAMASFLVRLSLSAAREMNNDNLRFLTLNLKTEKNTGHLSALHILFTHVVEQHTANAQDMHHVSRW